jgi:eukaryotic-like serine/threonine-protein kinase
MTPKQWQQIKSLFNEALPLPEAEQKSFLKEKCDDQIVCEKVSEMLKAHSGGGDFLENQTFQAEIFSDIDGEEDRYVGQQIRLYKIERRIGEGGMGHVYLAARQDDFHKKVALKIIKRGMDTDALLSRFRQERQILANLVHPNIARLLDGGSTGDGLPYLVMEYIEGKPVTEYCDQHTLTVPQRLQLFQKICEAISYAHQNLIVHRDIQPGNILVSQEGVPKLLDFGIAKLLDPQTEESHELTLEGARISTPEFASPEQIQGKPITTASDVYSLGILLYSLLTGRRPYHFDDRSSAAMEKVIVSTPPTKPSALLKKSEPVKPKQRSDSPFGVPMEKLHRQLEGDLDNIILKALQKEPEQRYASVEQFSEDIQRHLKGLPVTAREASMPYRSAKFIKRHRFALAAVMIIFLTLISAIIGIGWQAQIAKEEAQKAQQTLTFVEQMLLAADPLEAGKELTVEQILDQAGERISKELGGQPEIESEIHSILGEAYQNLGKYEKAKKHFEENLLVLKDYYGEKHFLVANAYRELAVDIHYIGNYKKADSLYRRSIALYRELGETATEAFGTALNDFGTMLLDQAHYDSAIVVFKESLKITQKVLQKNHSQIGVTLNNLAYAYDDKGDYIKADSAYNRALTIFRHNFGNEHPEIANTLNNYAFVKLNVGDTLASLQLHEQALAMYSKLLSEDYPPYATTLHNIASVTFYQKNYALAESKEKEVIKLFRKNYEEDHPNLGSAYFMMGRILNAQKRFDEAEHYLQKSLKIRQAKLDANHPSLAGAYLELGVSLLGQNKLKRSKNMLLKAGKIYKNNGVAEKTAFKKTQALLSKLNLQ